MKADFSKFKKMKSEESHTVFCDDKGHELRVAHKALSPKLKKQLEDIPSYADGGVVDEEEDSMINQGAEKLGNFNRDVTSKAFDYITDPVGSAYEDFTPGFAKEGLKMAGDAVGNAVSGAAKAYRSGFMGEAGKQAEGEAPIPQELPAPVVDEGPAPASLAAPQQSALAPSAQGLVQPAAPAMGNMGSVLGQYTSGVNKEAQALGDLGNEQALIRQENMDATLAAQQNFELNSQKIMNDYNAVMADYKNQHINKDQYMESRTSGQKVMAAIGLILGGFGAGLAGGENPAQKFLDDQMARDIKAQEAEMGKKENLLKFNMQQYGNLKDATAMTLAMTKGFYAEKLEAAAARSQDPLAKARAMQASAKYKAEIIPILQTTAANQSMQGMLQNPNASPLMKIQGLPKEMRDEALKEYAEYSKINSSLGQVDKILDANFNATKMGQNLTSPIQSKKAREVAYAELFPIVKAIVGEKMTDNDAKTLISPYLSGFTNNEKTNESIKQKLKEQLVAQARGRTPILSEYKIVKDLGSSVGASKDDRLKNWAKANPKDPRAKQIMQRLGN